MEGGEGGRVNGLYVDGVCLGGEWGRPQILKCERGWLDGDAERLWLVQQSGKGNARW